MSEAPNHQGATVATVAVGAEPPPRRHRKRIAGMVTAVSIALAAATGEVALRAAFSEEEVDGNYWGRGAFAAFPGAGYRHAPGFRGRAVRRGVFASPVAINAEGLRQTDLAAQLDHPRRLLVLGDSFPFGLGVREEEALPARLARRLNRHGVGVVNGAQTGYHVAQELAWGRHLLARIPVDEVLLTVFLNNDIAGDWFRDHERVEVRWGYRLSAGRWPRATGFDFVRTHSYLWMRGDAFVDRRRERRRTQDFRRAFEARPDAVLAASVDPLLALRDACASRGIALSVAMIPPRSGGTRFDDAFRAELARHAVPLIDLTGSLTDAHYFVGDGHWNAAGHELAAGHLAAALDQRPVAGANERAANPPLSARR